MLLVLIAPALTTYFWLQYNKKLVKREVKWKIINGIDKSELVLLRFTKAESKTLLRWKHSKEFEYKQQMYDIVEAKVVGDTTFYWCWWDFEETALNKQLADLLQNALNNNPQKREKEERFFTFLKSLYNVEKFNLLQYPPFTEEKQNSKYLVTIQSFRDKPKTPPPQFS